MLSWRPLQRSDYELLANWFAQPHVEPWWREPYDRESLEKKYGPRIDEIEMSEEFIVEYQGEPVGLIQRYLIDDHLDWAKSLSELPTPKGPLAGIDYLIGVSNLVGKGIGTRLIQQFVADTWVRYTGAMAIVAVPQQENQPSWRALEKAGFERTWTGVIRSDDPSDEGPCYLYVIERAQG